MLSTTVQLLVIFSSSNDDFNFSNNLSLKGAVMLTGKIEAMKQIYTSGI